MPTISGAIALLCEIASSLKLLGMTERRELLAMTDKGRLLAVTEKEY